MRSSFTPNNINDTQQSASAASSLAYEKSAVDIKESISASLKDNQTAIQM